MLQSGSRGWQLLRRRGLPASSAPPLLLAHPPRLRPPQSSTLGLPWGRSEAPVLLACEHACRSISCTWVMAASAARGLSDEWSLVLLLLLGSVTCCRGTAHCCAVLLLCCFHAHSSTPRAAPAGHAEPPCGCRPSRGSSVAVGMGPGQGGSAARGVERFTPPPHIVVSLDRAWYHPLSSPCMLQLACTTERTTGRLLRSTQASSGAGCSSLQSLAGLGSLPGIKASQQAQSVLVRRRHWSSPRRGRPCGPASSQH